MKWLVALLVALSLSLLTPALMSTLAGDKEEKGGNEDEKVTLDQCPPAVVKTIQDEAAGGTIREIEKETKDGVTIYEAEIVKDGQTIEIEVDVTGKLLEREVKGGTKAGGKQEEKISLDQCPAPVQETIKKEAAGGTIKEIEKETKDGVTIYEAEIVKNGQTIEIEVAADGKLLKSEVEDDKDDDGKDEGPGKK